MKIVLLDGDRIGNSRDMHRAFSEALGFPEWYGSNLDALHDMLSERSEEIGVILVNTDRLSENLGWRWEMLLRMLVEFKRENERFHVTLDPFGLAARE